MKSARCPDADKARVSAFLAQRTQGWVYKEIEHLVGLVRSKMSKEWTVCHDDQEDIQWGDGPIAKQLELPKLSAELPTDFKTYKILERQAALDIFDFYRGRDKATEEIDRVLSSYVTDPASKEKVKAIIAGSRDSGMVLIHDRRKRAV